MKKLRVLLAVSPFALVAGCNQPATNTTVANGSADEMMTLPADEMDTGSTADVTTTMTGQQFADAMGANGTYEIESSRMALAKSSSASAKKSAREKIEDHTRANAALKVAAAEARPSITPSFAMTPAQEDNLAALKAATGAEFDRLYTDQKIALHEAAIRQLQDYSTGGDVEPLRRWADDTLPMIKRHEANFEAAR